MPRITRLKLRLNSTSDYPSAEPGQALTGLTFGAVYSSEPKDENYIFGKATPFACLSTSILSSQAGHFEVGREYYVDIHVPDPE